MVPSSQEYSVISNACELLYGLFFDISSTEIFIFFSLRNNVLCHDGNNDFALRIVKNKTELYHIIVCSLPYVRLGFFVGKCIKYV